LLAAHLPPFLVEHPQLYGILSRGVHELTEQECLANFDALKVAIDVILDEKLIAFERERQGREAKLAIGRISGKS
jgi:hypothetical protein